MDVVRWRQGNAFMDSPAPTSRRRPFWVLPLVILGGALLAYGVFKLLSRLGY